MFRSSVFEGSDEHFGDLTVNTVDVPGHVTALFGEGNLPATVVRLVRLAVDQSARNHGGDGPVDRGGIGGGGPGNVREGAFSRWSRYAAA